MSNQIQIFTPSKSALIIECTAIAVMGFGSGLFILYWKGVPLNHAAMIAGLLALGGFVYYYRRGSKAALQRVVITPSDLTIIYAKGWPNPIRWNEIEEARLVPDTGFVWEIDTKWKIRLRDDGFTIDTWSQMSDLIEERLKQACVPCFRKDSLTEVAGAAVKALHR